MVSSLFCISVLVPGQLLLPIKDSVAFLLRRSGGCLHPPLHQSLRQQPTRPLLRGVPHPVAPAGALPFCFAWHFRRPVGGVFHPCQHGLVSTTEEHAPGPLPCVGGGASGSGYSALGLSKCLHAHEWQPSHLRAVQWLQPAGLVPAVWLHLPGEGWSSERQLKPRCQLQQRPVWKSGWAWSVHGHLAAGTGARL